MSEVATPPAAPPADTGAPAIPANPAAAAPNPAPDSPPAVSPSPAPNTDPAKVVPDGKKLPESVTGEKPVESPPFKLPDEYKDKPWAAKIKTAEDLYKQIDNLTTLVGKKVVVPDLTKATEAEREEYYAQTRPKDVAEYQFGETTDPLISKGMGESLMKNGVSATQANAIIADYQTAEKALLAAQYAPEAYEATMKETFGADYQKVIGFTKLALDGLMTPEDSKLLDNLPNAYLGLIHRTMGNVVKQYGIKESAAHTETQKGNPTPPDVNVVRETLRAEMGKLIHKPHTQDELDAIKKKLNDTYINDPRLQKKG